MNDKPLVSVIMNAYFSERFLKEALESVFDQTYRNWEIILWENVSSEAGTITREFDDPRIRYFHAPEKVSLYQSRVNAIREARGDYVAFLDCDDVWLPNKLALQLSAFNDGRCVVSCTDFFIHHGAQIPNDLTQLSTRLETYRSTQTRIFDVLTAYRVGMSTVMIHRSALPRILLNTVPEYSIIEDFDMILRVMSAGCLVPVTEALSVYRRHENNFSKRLDIELLEWQEWLSDLDAFSLSVMEQSLVRDFIARRNLPLQCRQSRLSGDRRGTWNSVRKLPWGLTKIKYLMSFSLPTSLLRRLVH